MLVVAAARRQRDRAPCARAPAHGQVKKERTGRKRGRRREERGSGRRWSSGGAACAGARKNKKGEDLGDAGVPGGGVRGGAGEVVDQALSVWWKEEALGRLGRFGLRGEALKRRWPLKSGSAVHCPSLDREGVRRRRWEERDRG